MIVGGRYNWKDQPERLIYLGQKHYPGDRRTWYRFARVEQPEVVWCEVLKLDLEHFEETRVKTKMVEFTEGELAGERAYVTFEDGDHLRVTPVKGDPLRSVALSRERGGFRELPPDAPPA